MDIEKLIKIDDLSDDEVAKLIRSDTFSLKKLSLEEVDKLCKRLICFDDDFSWDFWDKACAERRSREARIAKRKGKRLQAGGTWA
jgi:hypothetical protein